MNDIWKLVSEDLTHLGGPMGTEYTTTNFRKYYSSPELAKAAAEKNYKVWRKNATITWKRHGKDGFTSGDLAFVMYTISKVKLEE